MRRPISTASALWLGAALLLVDPSLSSAQPRNVLSYYDTDSRAGWSNCAINATLSNLSYKEFDTSSKEKAVLRLAVDKMGGELKTFVAMNDEHTHTQAFMFKRKVDDLIFIAIRGTQVSFMTTRGRAATRADVALDGRIGTLNILGTEMHLGFAKASKFLYGQTVLKLAQIYGGSRRAKQKAKIYITGHSLGGAAAQMLGIRLQRMRYQVEGVTTFGQPKIMKTKIKNGFHLLRFMYKDDVVSSLPPATSGFVHTGTPRQLNIGSRGRVSRRVAKVNLASRTLQHSLNNYLHYCTYRSDRNLRKLLGRMRHPNRR